MLRSSFAIAAILAAFPVNLSAEQWPSNVMQSIDVKEAAFCSVLSSYTDQMNEAVESKNQIKVRNVYQKQIMDIQALMPTGSFSDWIVKVDSVEVDAAFNATLKGTLPCHKNIVGVEIPETNTLTYGQLSDVSIGDFVLVSGQLSFVKSFKNLKPQDFKAEFSSIVGLN